jgi:phosphopantothenoylcysteine decarboxylase/phosphopantothenate--cysteine ligase
VRQNLDALIARGVQILEPGSGYLACGWIGKGRLAEPDEVIAAALQVLGPRRREASGTGPAAEPAASPPEGALAGRRVLVTAGPTYEDIDPVRYIGNRSSGRMGYAIAAEAVRRGALVTLVSGPTHLDAPSGADLVRVRSAAEMHGAVMSRADDQDVVIMSAAVADYTPADRSTQKIKKAEGPLILSLARTRDILSELGRLPARAAGRPVLVGFSAETSGVIAHARGKLETKAADLIVANDVSRADAGFDVDTNAVTLVARDGVEEVPLQAKTVVAARILDRVERLLAATPVRA